MSLNSQDIARIAHLARLELHPDESERMLAQINGFFAIVEKMRAVDTSGVEPLTHPVAAVRDGLAGHRGAGRVDAHRRAARHERVDDREHPDELLVHGDVLSARAVA